MLKKDRKQQDHSMSIYLAIYLSIYIYIYYMTNTDTHIYIYINIDIGSINISLILVHPKPQPWTSGPPDGVTRSGKVKFKATDLAAKLTMGPRCTVKKDLLKAYENHCFPLLGLIKPLFPMNFTVYCLFLEYFVVQSGRV